MKSLQAWKQGELKEEVGWGSSLRANSKSWREKRLDRADVPMLRLHLRILLSGIMGLIILCVISNLELLSISVRGISTKERPPKKKKKKKPPPNSDTGNGEPADMNSELHFV